MFGISIDSGWPFPDTTLYSPSDSATPPSGGPVSAHGRRSSPIVIDDDEDIKQSFDHLKYSFRPSTQPQDLVSYARLLPHQSRSRYTVSTDPIGPKAHKDYHRYFAYAQTLPSCRPQGPWLYDLLAGLPLDKFGVLAWSVIDKEEELFEINDTREEEKVMQALWSRWIMLNRRCVGINDCLEDTQSDYAVRRRDKFIPNYFEGVKHFIDEYGWMIHLAAGWGALRVWLFVSFRADQCIPLRC